MGLYPTSPDTFEPREIELGVKSENFYEVVSDSRKVMRSWLQALFSDSESAARCPSAMIKRLMAEQSPGIVPH